MLKHIYEFLERDDGPTAVEYAVMLALIVVACMVSVLQMSNATADSFDASAAELAGALGS
ncbi:Flp family type IVb pilin [Aeoliella sp. ICT_H6.2]|uniref:Flp family type IVb pilin n=1 Tax=Aeoliella straminimaris TaxID=2954799 RepID=A0A9X2FA64_9BACT|nr:Flp family type IVb pilin [Aeoliella straminimaris]MCO6044448.1 Flp family type IVb pilin [Aeoliella straminimaris]